MTSPDAALQNLVDDVADAILFSTAVVDVPVLAMRSLTIDVAATCMIRDAQMVERRLLNEFHSRLDQRVRAAVDDVGGARWRGLLRAMGQIFPTCH
jgi:hypothetical protein